MTEIDKIPVKKEAEQGNDAQKDNAGAYTPPAETPEKETPQGNAQKKTQDKPSHRSLKVLVVALILGAALYFVYNRYQKNEREKLEQKRLEQLQLQESERKKAAQRLDDMARWLTSRGLESMNGTPAVFTAKEDRASGSWQAKDILYRVDGLNVPRSPFKTLLWTKKEIAVNTETLKDLFAELLSGEYVPGTLPMLYKEDWAKAVGDFERELAGSSAPGTASALAVPKDEIEKKVRTALDTLGEDEYVAFAWQISAGAVSVRLIDKKCDSVYDRYYWGKKDGFMISDTKLSDWSRRLKGTLKVEPWIKPGTNGQITLHGRDLPEWNRENKERVLGQFVSELVGSLKESAQ